MFNIKLYKNVLIEGKAIKWYKALYYLSRATIDEGFAGDKSILNLLFAICKRMHRAHAIQLMDIQIEDFFEPGTKNFDVVISFFSKFYEWLEFRKLRGYSAEIVDVIVRLQQYAYKRNDNEKNKT